ncbi:asparaginase [Nocardioides sp. Soil805]|uniref:asparaginase n=1 Tax=Nocardioides sp. Soil805 TaxID=1736416 RepID=UPI0007032566|nr:asparaginase [Nocardioides sp. Soil805]KRF34920.1 asparaginase [Nocardioides sp. Soil805]
MAELAVVRRGGFVESRHTGHLVVLDRDGSEAVSLGSADETILPRSTLKPLQALACLRAGAPLVGEEVAIAAGSHTGEDGHVAVVRRLLARAGLDERALQCPVDLPEHEPTRQALLASGESPDRLRMNCSGKHAAMLLACATRGWDVEGYLDPDHPLQVQVRDVVEEMTGEPVRHVTVDGCGAPLLGVSVRGLARSFRGLALADEGSDPASVSAAMRTHPFFVGGDPHPNSDAMRQVPGLVAKGGAEGVIAMATDTGQAVALKMADGNPRATTLVALAGLRAVGVDVTGARSLMDLPVLGGGTRVGEIDLGADTASLRGAGA